MNNFMVVCFSLFCVFLCVKTFSLVNYVPFSEQNTPPHSPCEVSSPVEISGNSTQYGKSSSLETL